MARKIKPINPAQKYCSPRQAAWVMGISEYLLYRMYHVGQIPGAREIGGRILIPVSWVMGEVS
jgi:predicted DNA-binding transcriptional regulator AlpA